MCRKYVKRVFPEGRIQMSKIRMNISIDEDTAERLRQYAWENHSSVSKAVSDLIWSVKVKNEQIRGQKSFFAENNQRKGKSADNK